MSKAMSRVVFILLVVVFLVGFTAQQGLAIWTVLLDEHFDKNQQVPALRWVWNTPPQNPNIRWHWNPRPPHLRTEPEYTDYSWGLQDYIFNNRVRQNEEFPGSIWCAYTNRNMVDNPRWPEDDLYMDNQNAWTWWGPFNLTRAATAAVSFWVYVDVQYGVQDSLSVVVGNRSDLMTLNGANFRQNLAFGFYRYDTLTYLTTFPHRMQDWQRREFYLDSLRLLNAQGRIRDTVSYCMRDTSTVDSTWTLPGYRTCYLAFVWHSNARVIQGRGAFIDDVMVMMDDGLFELASSGMDFGYPVDEENVDWDSHPPATNESVYFRYRWVAQGSGEVGPFTIRCLLDDEEIYSEERTVIAGQDTVYQTITDELWETVAGHHVLRWEIDTPIDEGGRVVESNEDNNFMQSAFDIEWNPPPEFMIHTPAEDSVAVHVNVPQQIFYTVSDSNETDIAFTIYMYWTYDTTGLASNPDTIYYYNYIDHDFGAPLGDSSFFWDPMNDFRDQVLDTNTFVYVVGFAADGFAGNQTRAVAPGRFYILPAPNAAGLDPAAPLEFALERPFPNPFNKSVMIEYTLPERSSIKMSVFDLSGRRIATLAEGSVSAGRHLVNWSPTNVGAGVYLIKMETPGGLFMQKAVFTP